MSLGLLFPGQGSQHPDMLPWLLHATPPCGSMGLLGNKLGKGWQARLADTSWSSRNDVAQLALTGICLAAWEQVRALLPVPVVVAGYSVGEIAAFSVAGVFSASVAMRVAEDRARIMNACIGDNETGLLAVSDAGTVLIDRLHRVHHLDLAIRLSADRCIVGGLRVDIAAATQELAGQGIACTQLDVAIASHTRWLDQAVKPLELLLTSLEFDPPQVALVCNIDGASRRDPDELRSALAGQVSQTVHWDRCMETVKERRVRCILEVGPGTTLSRLWNSRHPALPARSLDEFKTPQQAAEWARRTLAQ